MTGRPHVRAAPAQLLWDKRKVGPWSSRIYYLATDAPLAKMEKCVNRISDLVTLQRAYDDLTHRVRLAQVKWEQGKLTFEEREFR